MKCSIIQDLLPLYEEGLCSAITSGVVREHLNICKDCNSSYISMKDSLKYDSSLDAGIVDIDTDDIWYNFYKRLILKGIALFGIVYLIIIVGIMIFK